MMHHQQDVEVIKNIPFSSEQQQYAQ